MVYVALVRFLMITCFSAYITDEQRLEVLQTKLINFEYFTNTPVVELFILMREKEDVCMDLHLGGHEA